MVISRNQLKCIDEPAARSSSFVLSLFIALVVSILMMGCGGQDSNAASLRIDVYGWGPSPSGDTGFLRGIPTFQDARSVRIKLIDPLRGEVIETRTVELSNNGGELPEVSFADQLRLEVEVLNSLGNIIASGATPRFAFVEGSERLIFRIQVLATNSFAPVGSVVVDNVSGDLAMKESRFDYRGYSEQSMDDFWLGRIGHAMASTNDGRLLIVGGANSLEMPDGIDLPSVSAVYDDIQIFDPKTGYFTELSQHPDAVNQGADVARVRLGTARAFHTVTPLGQDRFLVAGGMTLRGGELRALSSLEIIDLNAPNGQWVQEFQTASGGTTTLSEARAFHTANRIAGSSQVILVGGMGSDGLSSTRRSFEMIDVVEGINVHGKVDLEVARTGHATVLSADGRSIWVLGGRNASGVLASTEQIVIQGGQPTSLGGPAMSEPRFEMDVVRLSASNNDQFLVLGGYRNAEGQATASYEIGSWSREQFFANNRWLLKTPRAGLSAVELPFTRDIAVVGGLLSPDEVVRTAERLSFQGLTEEMPFIAYDDMGQFYKARHGMTASLLSNGRMLLVGGMGPTSAMPYDNAELYNPLNMMP